MTQAGIARKVRIRVDHRADIATIDAAFHFQERWQKPTVLAQRQDNALVSSGFDRGYRRYGIQGKGFLDEYMLLRGGDGRHLFGMLGVEHGRDDGLDIGIV